MKKVILFKSVIMFTLFLCGSITAQDNIKFEIEKLNGEKVDFSVLLSEGPVLVNFWALWCKPCKIEMKALQDLYKEFSGKGFTIVGINQDTPRSVSKVESYIATHGITYPIMIDPEKDLYERFNVQVLPYSLLYDQNGKVVYTQTGYLPGDEEKLHEEVQKLLGEK